MSVVRLLDEDEVEVYYDYLRDLGYLVVFFPDIDCDCGATWCLICKHKAKGVH